MSKKLPIIFLFFAVGLQVIAQIAKPVIQHKSEPKPKVAEKEVETILKIGEYEYECSFGNGRARVKENGKFGFKDKTGKLVIPCIYDFADGFSDDGFCLINNDGYYGYINKMGIEIVPIRLFAGFKSVNGIAPIQDEFFKNKILNLNTGRAIDINVSITNKFSEGLAPIHDDTYRCGFIDTQGNIVIPCNYTIVSNFSEGFAYVEINKTGEVLKQGYINRDNEFIIKWEAGDGYQFAGDFNNGLARVQGWNNWGFIDKSGKIVIPTIYSDACDFSNDLARVQDENKKWGFIDKSGKIVIPIIYSDACDFSNDLARVQDENKKWGFIDKSGKIVIPIKYSDAMDFSEGFAKVAFNGKWKFIDKNDKDVKVILE
jgi:hypothetical protein